MGKAISVRVGRKTEVDLYNGIIVSGSAAARSRKKKKIKRSNGLRLGAARGQCQLLYYKRALTPSVQVMRIAPRRRPVSTAIDLLFENCTRLHRRRLHSYIINAAARKAKDFLSRGYRKL